MSTAPLGQRRARLGDPAERGLLGWLPSGLVHRAAAALRFAPVLRRTGKPSLARMTVQAAGLRPERAGPEGGRRPLSCSRRPRANGSGSLPKVVGIGGGTGLSRLLRGLKTRVDDLTAIVTVADDGGSSGRLRRQLGLLPPGDFRQCIAALAEAEPTLVQLFEHRFRDGGDLKGHSFGNLFIAAMSEITGSFERALQESGRVLAVRGQILPSTFENVELCAELMDRRSVRGESRIGKGGSPIARVFLHPEKPAANAKAVAALAEADVIVVGPGSLYTSVLPNLLIPEIASTLRESSAIKIYVCNVATQPGETDGYDLEGHVGALESHLGAGAHDKVFDFVLANSNLAPPIPEGWPARHVETNGRFVGAAGTAVRSMDLIDEEWPTQHHPEKLAEAILQIGEERHQRVDGGVWAEPASAARGGSSERRA